MERKVYYIIIKILFYFSMAIYIYWKGERVNGVMKLYEETHQQMEWRTRTETGRTAENPPRLCLSFRETFREF